VRRPRLLWQLYLSYLVLTLASLVAVGWLASHSLEQFYRSTARAEQLVQAELFARRIAPLLEESSNSQLAEWAEEFEQLSGARATVVAPDGRVLADTREDPSVMDNHAGRVEIAAALRGEVGTDLRTSDTLHHSTTYLAVPLRDEGRIVAVLRTALPTTEVDRALGQVRLRIVLGGVGVASVAAASGLWFSRRISRPLEEIRRGAERFARGDLKYSVPLPHTAEMAAVAESLNRMAQQLEHRIRANVRQNTEQEAVLASMVEGVLAVDTDERVISLNQAAAELLGSNQAEAQGRHLQEVIRNADLRRFVATALNCAAPVEGDVVLGSGHDRVLQAHGTALRDVAGQAIGAVIVLNDITRLRRLENLRRDFVANVSHELKTPITSIKGFVETLLDGALHQPEDAERFLRIVAKQADRLNAIIEDLLSLSRIEQGEETGDIVLERLPLRPVLLDALDEIAPRAADKRIEIRLACDEALAAEINAPLLEQAVINLLDNAVKYSEPGREVDLTAAKNGGEVLVTVRDQGCGVEAEHVPRLFERFYRVDRARSRKLGGTGLGLAIVKHIVNAHGGQVTVESTPGRGSAFTIRLPA